MSGKSSPPHPLRKHQYPAATIQVGFRGAICILHLSCWDPHHYPLPTRAFLNDPPGPASGDQKGKWLKKAA